MTTEEKDLEKPRVFVIEVSLGELLDRLSILEVKAARLAHRADSNFVSAEVDRLYRNVPEWAVNSRNYSELKDVNAQIFDWMEKYFTESIEESQMLHFLRETIRLNIVRSELKRKVDLEADSQIFEVKSYFGNSK